MPRETFVNLAQDKRNLIISAAMNEFSKASYNASSINKICMVSNILKAASISILRISLIYMFILWV